MGDPPPPPTHSGLSVQEKSRSWTDGPAATVCVLEQHGGLNYPESFDPSAGPSDSTDLRVTHRKAKTA